MNMADRTISYLDSKEKIIALKLENVLRELNDIPETLREIEEPTKAEIIEMFIIKILQIKEGLWKK